MAECAAISRPTLSQIEKVEPTVAMAKHKDANILKIDHSSILPFQGAAWSGMTKLATKVVSTLVTRLVTE
ncbi:hypothetical protein [uncultured Pontibacter sp.]|uniref:hypothetical protein n=1 Tax=uncultured Pontibacter sp. TaxID=453356 RepID=UPI002634D202|nr:hypothetical protein [uncultured Pontibacter sp.]